MCFNPCFNGFTTLTHINKKIYRIYKRQGFNPCFNGFTTLTGYKKIYIPMAEEVSILVLMDSLL